jgi:hypothetical protein
MRQSVANLLCFMMMALVAACATRSGDREAEAHQADAGLEFSERVVAGGPSDFMEVRHIILAGSNLEIGKKLAEIASSRHASGPIPSPSPEETQAQRQYFERTYPIYLDRMRGVADASGKDLQDASWNFAGLYYGLPFTGCSVVFYPPNTTTDGRGVLSRNFDFTTGTFLGTEPGPGRSPACAHPYVIEMYPDRGYGSLVTCCFDLLGGVCDGINAEGLTVAILSDNDAVERYGLHPSPGPREGFNEVQVLRYLLDSCADTEQARAALERATLYYNMAPSHYIIADRHGRSFLWEQSPETGGGHVVQCDSVPLLTSNFLLHLYPDRDQLPAEEHPLGWFNRYRAMRDRITAHGGKFDRDFITETNQCVSFTQSLPAGHGVTNRTLWHALYCPERRRVEIDFYLGEETDPDAPNRVRIRRSGYKVFALRQSA